MADFIFHNKRLARKALRGGLVIPICWLWPGEDIDSVSAADNDNKKAVLPQGNRAMPQVFFSVEVRQQHSLQV